ncbi:MAG: glycosyltransferase family 2 protein [Lachnospiraceae bacterium]|nr:glycosyltransferase family 2 protein [Lachnospiraceae bacterium]
MQTLLSIMEQGDPLTYIEKLNIQTDTVIVNQCGRDGSSNVRVKLKAGNEGSGNTERELNICLIERNERGLSKSRNLALSEASDDICIFCDNDVRYVDDAPRIIEDAFKRHPEAGIICFFIERPERHRPVKLNEGGMSKKDMMRIFSPEMAVRRSGIRDLQFDEDFGAGARYKMGEENIFLFEAARRKIERIYVPVKIAETIANESSWFTAYDRDFYISRGAGYEAMDKKLWHLLTWQNLLRKRHEYGATISTLDAYRAMKEGRREYRELLAGRQNG